MDRVSEADECKRRLHSAYPDKTVGNLRRRDLIAAPVAFAAHGDRNALSVNPHAGYETRFFYETVNSRFEEFLHSLRHRAVIMQIKRRTVRSRSGRPGEFLCVKNDTGKHKPRLSGSDEA